MSNPKITSIWYEFEEWTSYNESDENSDVIFELDNGSKWVVSFFTYQNVLTLRDKNKQTGESLNGRYFSSTDMVLIEKMNKSLIIEVITEMIIRDEISVYCSNISEADR